MTGSERQFRSGVVWRGSDGAPFVERVDLFPTRVWQARLNGLALHLPAWIDAVSALRRASPEPAGRSNRLGWNSLDMAMLKRPEFGALQAAVRTCCAQAIQQMGHGEFEFELESWVNMHDRGGFNFPHVHDGALLSGVFYLQSPEGSGSLIFRDPRPSAINASSTGAGANAHNEVHLRPEAGMLVLFPPWLEHYVEVHQSDVARIAISFNVL